MAKKNGRPRALNDTKRREICALVTAGAGIHRAAQYVGCSHSTICREARRDEDFREQLRRAKATTQLAPLQAMRQAAQSNWRAAAWMLERTDPEHFGRRQRNTLGAKELRALARDLMTIFNDLIENPLLRDQAAERVQATINYAMRHAWDSQRSGSSLRQAMEFFAQTKPANDPWDAFESTLSSFAAMPQAHSEDCSKDLGFAKDNHADLAKPREFCNPPQKDHPTNPASKEDRPSQNP